MSGDFLYGVNEGLLAVLLIVLFYSAVEVGFWLGKRSPKQDAREREAHIATIEAALLGLLALLLGFGFSMAVNRFDSRRTIVVSEANDIGTTYLRAGLLPEKQQSTTKQLLRDYIDSRIAFYQAGRDLDKTRNALTQATTIQGLLWKQALSAASNGGNPVLTGLFISALNELIDVHTERIAALENHVPEAILLLLIFVGASTLAVTGYRAGFGGIRLSIPRIILVILIVATLEVIIDLDRPRRGFIKVSESALLELKTSLSNDLSF